MHNDNYAHSTQTRINANTPHGVHGAPSNWNDFNDAEAQQSGFDLIPKGTRALVRMSIKPGGHDDESAGWTGGYATASSETGAIFLSCEFVLLTGAFAKRKVWSNVGLHSNKGPTWANMGRSFIKAVLNSSRNIHPHDNSPEAQQARQIGEFSELDGIEFVASIGIENDGKGELRNLIRLVIEPDHKDYAELMAAKFQRDDGHGGGSNGGSSGAPAGVVAAAHAPKVNAPRANPPRANVPQNSSTQQGRPTWAQ